MFWQWQFHLKFSIGKAVFLSILLLADILVHVTIAWFKISLWVNCQCFSKIVQSQLYIVVYNIRNAATDFQSAACNMQLESDFFVLFSSFEALASYNLCTSWFCLIFEHFLWLIYKPFVDTQWFSNDLALRSLGFWYNMADNNNTLCVKRKVFEHKLKCNKWKVKTYISHSKNSVTIFWGKKRCMELHAGWIKVKWTTCMGVSQFWTPMFIKISINCNQTSIKKR